MSRVLVFAAAFAALVVAASVPHAQEAAPAPPPRAAATGIGDVNLTPRRLVLSGRQRSGEVVVFNRGTAPATYRVELQDLAMSADGALVEPSKLPAAAQARLKSAKEMIRFSPRRIVLAPGQSQVIRVLARPPASDAPAEYRAHMVVSAVPPPEAGLDVARAAGGPGELRVQIIPIFGISIPIIARSGEPTATLAIRDARLNRTPQGAELTATLARSGPRSVYGDLQVVYTPAGARDPVEVGLLRGVGVYPEVDARPVRVALAPPAGVALGAGKYQVLFRDDEVTGGAVLAQTDVSGP